MAKNGKISWVDTILSQYLVGVCPLHLKYAVEKADIVRYINIASGVLSHSNVF